MKPPRLTINEGRREVFLGAREISLASKEFDILVELRDAGTILNRQALIGSIWPAEKALDLDLRTVDQHIARIRRKLGDGIIKTVSGHGYKFAA